MAEVFATGEIAVAIVAAMLIEFLMLVWWRRQRRRGPRPVELFSGLAAGAALLLALRASLQGTGWRDIAAWLLVALVAHVADLVLRWNRVHP